MESNKPNQILYRTHYTDHKNASLSVSQALTNIVDLLTSVCDIKKISDTYQSQKNYAPHWSNKPFQSHDRQQGNLLKECCRDKQITIAILATMNLSKQFPYNHNRQTGHTTFHSHDHQTDNLLRESGHDNSKQIITTSLATTILSKQFCHYNCRQITFYGGHTTFHSHDHQTDDLLRE